MEYHKEVSREGIHGTLMQADSVGDYVGYINFFAWCCCSVAVLPAVVLPAVVLPAVVLKCCSAVVLKCCSHVVLCALAL